jgi:hypothetical protein
MLLNKLQNYSTIIGGDVAFVQDGAGFSRNMEYLGEVDENNFLVIGDAEVLKPVSGEVHNILEPRREFSYKKGRK